MKMCNVRKTHVKRTLNAWLGHSNVFFFCFASDENPNTYKPEQRKKKQTKNLNKTNTYLVNQLK